MILITVFVVGAASSYRQSSGATTPLELAVLLFPAITAPILASLYLRARRPVTLPAIMRADRVQFSVIPSPEFLESIATIRWQHGDSTPVPAIPRSQRPVVVLDAERLDIWGEPDDPLPLISVRSNSIESLRAGEGSAPAIIVEAAVRSQLFELPLAMADAADPARPASARDVAATIAWMDSIIHGLRLDEES